MNNWDRSAMILTYRLGEKRLWATRLQGLIYRPHFLKLVGSEEPAWPFDRFPSGVQAVQLPSFPVSAPQPRLTLFDTRGIRYVPRQYTRHYIEMGGTFEDYLKQFSGKTRSTLRRKVKKYAEHTTGQAADPPFWREYRRADEMSSFRDLARQVARKTYQERLGFQASIPEGPEFIAHAQELADQGAARGYILFHGDRPSAYLFCPVVDGVMLYQHVGHDPDYEEWSPGTVLLFLVLERLFAAGEVRCFDFTEGEGAHKEMFANRHVPCADILYFRRTPKNLIRLVSHAGLASFSRLAAGGLECLGLKRRLKKFFRGGS